MISDSWGVWISVCNMTFTSIEFLFAFLPLTLLGYYLIDGKIKNMFLLGASLLFYSAGEPTMVFLLMISIAVNYFFGLLLGNEWKRVFIKKVLLVMMLMWNFGLLFYYKYLRFSLETINSLFGDVYEIPTIILPLGISFFTFRAVSYCVDVYWASVPVQKNIFNVALYISFFPQISMGPITEYNDFSKQLYGRHFDIEVFSNGARRVIIGLFKKLVISDSISTMVDSIFTMEGAERTILLAWFGIMGYLIQLYYDFSGYSDIAIGIGELLGFKAPENFNYPYMSKSIAEFWGRWHITLGTWLKDYIYIPVSRTLLDKGISVKRCDYLALLCVWLFAGIWHGAGVAFLVYGLYNCFFIILERIISNYRKQKRKRLNIKKEPETIMQAVRAHIYCLLVLLFGQLLFRSNNMAYFWEYVKSMFGLCGNAFTDAATIFWWKQDAVVFLIGMVFCFPVVKMIKQKCPPKVVDVLTPITYVVVAIIAIAFAFTSTYQAFIYFQF